jgi:hypothetical protein
VPIFFREEIGKRRKKASAFQSEIVRCPHFFEFLLGLPSDPIFLFSLLSFLKKIGASLTIVRGI